MANTYTSLGGLFTAIANAIRAKKGTTDTIVADNFPSEIESIASQPSLQSKTVSPSIAAQKITPDSGYDGLSEVTVDAISPTKGAQTYTPTTTDQTISSGRWLTGAQTIKGDANLVAAKIKNGVSIFGVSGSYSGQYKFSYFSGISRYSSTEIRIPVDLDIDYVVGVAIKSNDFIHGDWTYNGGLFSVMWWDNGTEYGDGNRWRLSTTGDAGTGSDNLDIPIKIGGPSSGLYARLIAQGGGKWADGCTYEGFIVYKVYGS